MLLSKIDILANDPSNFHRVMVSPAYCISSARDPGKKKMLKFFCFLVKTPLTRTRRLLSFPCRGIVKMQVSFDFFLLRLTNAGLP